MPNVITEFQIDHQLLKTDDLPISSSSSKTKFKSRTAQLNTYVFPHFNNHLTEVITYQGHQMLVYQCQKNTVLMIKPKQLFLINYPYSPIHEKKLNHLS